VRWPEIFKKNFTIEVLKSPKAETNQNNGRDECMKLSTYPHKQQRFLRDPPCVSEEILLLSNASHGAQLHTFAFCLLTFFYSLNGSASQHEEPLDQ
jgi:hypothetical protein